MLFSLLSLHLNEQGFYIVFLQLRSILKREKTEGYQGYSRVYPSFFLYKYRSYFKETFIFDSFDLIFLQVILFSRASHPSA